MGCPHDGSKIIMISPERNVHAHCSPIELADDQPIFGQLHP